MVLFSNINSVSNTEQITCTRLFAIHHRLFFFKSLVALIDFFLGVLTPLSAIFQLYHGDQC